MRKIAAYLFLVLSFFLNGGLTMEIHYCMGEPATYGFWQEAEMCSAFCEPNTPLTEHEHASVDGKSCCSTTSIHSLSSELGPMSGSTLSKVIHVNLVSFPAEIPAVTCLLAAQRTHVNPPPELIGAWDLSLLCRYLI